MSNLTAQQAIIVRMVRSGLSNKEIARALGVSEGTVKAHLHNIFDKLRITNRHTLVASKSFEG